MNSVSKSVLGAKLGKDPTQRGFISAQPVCLSAGLSANVKQNAVIAGTTNLNEHGYSWQNLSSPQAKQPRSLVHRKARPCDYPLTSYLLTVQDPSVSLPPRYRWRCPRSSKRLAHQRSIRIEDARSVCCRPLAKFSSGTVPWFSQFRKGCR